MDEKNISNIGPISPEPPSYEGPPKVKKEHIGKDESHTFKRPPVTKKDVHKGVEAFLAEQRKARKDAEMEVMSTAPAKEVRSHEEWKKSRGVKAIKKTRVTEFLTLLQSGSREEKFIAEGKGELQKVNKATPWLIRKLGLSQAGKSIQVRNAFRTIMKAAKDEMKIPAPYRNLKDTLSLLTELKTSSWSKAVLKRNRTIATQFNKVFSKASTEAIDITKESLKDIQKGIDRRRPFPEILNKLELLKANPIAQHAFNVDKTLKKQFNELYDQQTSEYVGEQLQQIEELSRDNPGTTVVFDELRDVRLHPISEHVFKNFPTLKNKYDKLYHNAIEHVVDHLATGNAMTLKNLSRAELLLGAKYAGKPEFAAFCPNFAANKEAAEKLKSLVEAKVLSKSDLKQRTFEYEKWVTIAYRCYKKGNINSALSIVGGLTTSATVRLRETKSELSPRAKKQMAKLDIYFAKAKPANLRSLVKQLHKRTDAPIPYMGWPMSVLMLQQERKEKRITDMKDVNESLEKQYKEQTNAVLENYNLSIDFNANAGRNEGERLANRKALEQKINENLQSIENLSKAITIKEEWIAKYKKDIKNDEDIIENMISMMLDFAKRSTTLRTEAHLASYKHDIFQDDIEQPLSKSEAYDISIMLEPNKA